jgi:hypothetical protein
LSLVPRTQEAFAAQLDGTDGVIEGTRQVPSVPRFPPQDFRKEFDKMQFQILVVHHRFPDEPSDGDRTSEKPEDTADRDDDDVIQRLHTSEFGEL